MLKQSRPLLNTLRARKSSYSAAFALPTILIASVVMLSVLVAAVSVTASIRASLREESYTKLAEAAGEAGMAYAKACLRASNNHVTWSDAKPLKPNTDCLGSEVAGLSPYLVDTSAYQTYFVVGLPDTNSSGQPIHTNSKGYVAVLRTSTGIAWRIFSSNVALAYVAGDVNGVDQTPVGTSITGYWSTAPAGYLLEDGACVSQATYAALYSVIGTIFGTSGCNGGQFRLPDSRGRIAVNLSPSDTEFNSMGEKYGEKTHVLTIAEMPKHDHNGGLANPYVNDGSLGGVPVTSAAGSSFGFKLAKGKARLQAGTSHTIIYSRQLSSIGLLNIN